MSAPVTFEFTGDVSKLIAAVQAAGGKVADAAGKVTVAFNDALGKVDGKKHGENAGKAFANSFTAHTEKLKSSLADVGKTALGFLSGGLAIGGVEGIVHGFEDIVRAGKKDIELGQDLKLSFQQAGLSGEKLGEQLKVTGELADKLSMRFAVDDDTVKELAKSAASLGGATGQANADMVQLALGVEKATGGMMSGEQAIRLFSRGAADPENLAALDRLRMKFPALAKAMTEGGSIAEKMSIAMRVLGPTFTAMEEQANGPIGSMKRFEIAMDNAKKTAGTLIIEAVAPLLEGFSKVAQWIQNAVIPIFSAMAQDFEKNKVVILGVIGAITIAFAPWLAAIAGVVAAFAFLRGAMDNGAESQMKAADAQEELIKKQIESKEHSKQQAEGFGKLSESYKELASKANRTAAEERELRDVTVKINQQYPDTIKGGSDLAQNFRDLGSAAQQAKKDAGDLTQQIADLGEKEKQVAQYKLNLEVNIAKERVEKDLADATGNFLNKASEAVFGTSTARKNSEEMVKKYTDAVYTAQNSAKITEAISSFQSEFIAKSGLSDEDQAKLLTSFMTFANKRDAVLRGETEKPAAKVTPKPAPVVDDKKKAVLDHTLEDIDKFIRDRNAAERTGLDKETEQAKNAYADQQKKLDDALKNKKITQAQYNTETAKLETSLGLTLGEIQKKFREQEARAARDAEQKKREERRKFADEEAKSHADILRRIRDARIAAIADESARDRAAEDARYEDQRAADDAAFARRRADARKNAGLTWQDQLALTIQLANIDADARLAEEDREAAHQKKLADIDKAAYDAQVRAALELSHTVSGPLVGGFEDAFSLIKSGFFDKLTKQWDTQNNLVAAFFKGVLDKTAQLLESKASEGIVSFVEGLFTPKKKGGEDGESDEASGVSLLNAFITGNRGLLGKPLRWYGDGGAFTANEPTVIGVGESGPEDVYVIPKGMKPNGIGLVSPQGTVSEILDMMFGGSSGESSRAASKIATVAGDLAKEKVVETTLTTLSNGVVKHAIEGTFERFGGLTLAAGTEMFEIASDAAREWNEKVEKGITESPQYKNALDMMRGGGRDKGGTGAAIAGFGLDISPGLNFKTNSDIGEFGGGIPQPDDTTIAGWEKLDAAIEATKNAASTARDALDGVAKTVTDKVATASEGVSQSATTAISTMRGAAGPAIGWLGSKFQELGNKQSAVWGMATGAFTNFIQATIDGWLKQLLVKQTVGAAEKGIEAAGATASTAAAQAKTAANTSVTMSNIASAESGVLAAHSSIPFVGIMLGLAGLAVIASQWNNIKKLLGFEHGGLAMVGEKGPEVIAPAKDFSHMISQLVSETTRVVAQNVNAGRMPQTNSAELIGEVRSLRAAMLRAKSNVDVGVKVGGGFQVSGGKLSQAIQQDWHNTAAVYG